MSEGVSVMSGRKGMQSAWDGQRPWTVVADSIVSLFLVSPLVVGYWRGTWFLLDTFLYPPDDVLSCWISLILGFVILLPATWFQVPLQKFAANRNPFVYFIFSRIYTITMCLGCVNHWRGVWATLDAYTGIGWLTQSLSLGFGISGLILLRCFRNIMAPPSVLIVDAPEDYFTFPTMFRTADSKVCHLIALDGLFSVTVVGSLVVLVWRGSFGILDLVMFPSDSYWSAWGSVILGYSTTILSFSLQVPLSSFCSRKIDGFWRVAVVDLFTAVSYLGDVNVWRGIWQLYDLYLFPDEKVMSCFLTHAAGLIILSICYCAHSILVRGVYLDAEEPGAKAGVLSYSYIRYFLRKKRTRDVADRQKSGSKDPSWVEDNPLNNGDEDHSNKETTKTVSGVVRRPTENGRLLSDASKIEDPSSASVLLDVRNTRPSSSIDRRWNVNELGSHEQGILITTQEESTI